MSEEKQSFEERIADSPQVIQDLAKKYPPGEYVIREGAPYGISCPGTKVSLHGYFENGDVQVVVLAKDKLPSAIDHERRIGARYGRTPEELDKIKNSDVLVEIDPKWMKRISVEVLDDETGATGN